MSLGLYGSLILFGLFVLLLIFNPNLSCFGRTIRSPFYPLFRKRRQRRIKAEDYGFRLVDELRTRESQKAKESSKERKPIKTENYGFKLVEDKETPPEGQERENQDD